MVRPVCPESAAMKPSISLLLLLALVGTATAGSVGGSTGTNAPVLKNVLLVEFKQKGARAISFCSTSQVIFVAFSGEDSRKVHRWNLGTGREEGSYPVPRGYRCDYTATSPDAKLLLISAYDLVQKAPKKVFKVLLVDTRTGKVIKQLEYPDSITYLQFSRDGQRFRLSPGLPSRYPEWAGAVFDRKGEKVTELDANIFDPAESFILARGRDKDPDLYYTAGATPRKLVGGAFEYLSSAGGTLLAASTFAGDVVIWRTSDLKEVFRHPFGRHPVFLRFDLKMSRFLVVNGNESEDSTLHGIQTENPQ